MALAWASFPEPKRLTRTSNQAKDAGRASPNVFGWSFPDSSGAATGSQTVRPWQDAHDCAELRLVAKPLLMTILPHPLAALMLGDFGFSFFLKRTHRVTEPGAQAAAHPTIGYDKLQLTSFDFIQFLRRAPCTMAACCGGFTLRKIAEIRPSGSMTKVVRSMPMCFLPMKDFSTHTP